VRGMAAMRVVTAVTVHVATYDHCDNDITVNSDIGVIIRSDVGCTSMPMMMCRRDC